MTVSRGGGGKDAGEARDGTRSDSESEDHPKAELEGMEALYLLQHSRAGQRGEQDRRQLTRRNSATGAGSISSGFVEGSVGPLDVEISGHTHGCRR